MAEESKVHVMLADGTEFDALPDGAGNLIVSDIGKSVFTDSNLNEVTIEDGRRKDTFVDQVLRDFTEVAGGIRIRLSERNDIEKIQKENAQLRADNDMLIECILEMSEIIYGE